MAIFMTEKPQIMDNSQVKTHPAVYRLMSAWELLYGAENKGKPHGILPSHTPKQAQVLISDLLNDETGLDADWRSFCEEILAEVIGDVELTALHRLQILIIAYYRAVTPKTNPVSSCHIAANLIFTDQTIYSYSHDNREHTLRPLEMWNHLQKSIEIHQQTAFPFVSSSEPGHTDSPTPKSASHQPNASEILPPPGHTDSASSHVQADSPTPKPASRQPNTFDISSTPGHTDSASTADPSQTPKSEIPPDTNKESRDSSLGRSDSQAMTQKSSKDSKPNASGRTVSNAESAKARK